MLKKIIPVAVSAFLAIAGLLPAVAQGAQFDTGALYRAGGPIRAISIGSNSSNSSNSSNGAPGSSGNTTYKTGEGPSASLNPPSSNRTSNQRTGTLTIVSTAGLAPMIGVDASSGSTGQDNVGSALGGAVGGAIGGALGGTLGSALGGNIGSALASTGGQDGATASIGNAFPQTTQSQIGGFIGGLGLEANSTALASGSGF